MNERQKIIDQICATFGARSEVVESLIVEENRGTSMGVYIDQGIRIHDRATAEMVYGRIPGGSDTRKYSHQRTASQLIKRSHTQETHE